MRPIDFVYIEKTMRDNPADWYSSAESEARFMAAIKAVVTPRPTIDCAVCGRPCCERKAGWYCKTCDAYSETDVEIED